MARKGSAKNEQAVATRFFVIGCVVLAFALLIAGAGFFIRDLSPDQRIVLCWACSLAAGFAAGSFAGSAYLSYQVNTSTVGNVLIVTTSGFVVWLITFYFLYQTIGPRPSTVTVQLLDASTDEPISRDFAVTFTDDDSNGPRVEQGAGGRGILHSWPAPAVVVNDVDCRGYAFQEKIVADDHSLTLTMNRTDQFPYIIQPKLNAALDSESFRLADLPKSTEVRSAVDVEAPDEVVFTCVNFTDRHVDVLLWHYPPDGGGHPLAFPVQQLKGCPIPPGGEGKFDDFALTPGYFLIFVSWHGKEAMLVTHGNLYQSLSPTLTLQKFGADARGIKGYLTF